MPFMKLGKLSSISGLLGVCVWVCVWLFPDVLSTPVDMINFLLCPLNMRNWLKIECWKTISHCLGLSVKISHRLPFPPEDDTVLEGYGTFRRSFGLGCRGGVSPWGLTAKYHFYSFSDSWLRHAGKLLCGCHAASTSMPSHHEVL